MARRFQGTITRKLCMWRAKGYTDPLWKDSMSTENCSNGLTEIDCCAPASAGAFSCQVTGRQREGENTKPQVMCGKMYL